MKTRHFPEHNYKSFFINGKTIRIKIDPSKPITDLKYPEFMDVKITNFCSGECPYCYQNSGRQDDPGYINAFDKIESYFGSLTENQRPFQVAIGGGNPNQHHDFSAILSLFHCLGITPNYTTNGIGLQRDVLEATKKYCGGVAISCHPHLKWQWEDAIDKISPIVQTNLHLIISDRESIDNFVDIYRRFNDRIKYFVLLPYEKAGRAEEKGIDYNYLTSSMNRIGSTKKIAFGANFYMYLQCSKFNISLYEPEIYSKYLDIKDMKMYYSSFNLKEVKSLE